jgi:hypothetical protein
VPVTWADPDGVVRVHRIDAVAIETAIDLLLYEPSGRMLIQRAVAAAARDDLVPLARMTFDLTAGAAVGASIFPYYAVTCADYRVSPTADANDLAAVIAAGKPLGIPALRTDEVFTSPYPCLAWPYQPTDATRPAPLTDTPFPVFVLAATGDPITPVGPAGAIAARLADGYLIVTAGGPHVTFGRGSDCVDRPVVAFLLRAERPASRLIACDGLVATPYIPLTARTKNEYADPLEAMDAAERELFASPEYVLWDRGDEVRVGCREGGFVAITPATFKDNIRFAECANVSGLPITGLGTYVLDTHVVSWSVTAPDGTLDYVRTDDSRHVTGTWEGEAVDLSR